MPDFFKLSDIKTGVFGNLVKHQSGPDTDKAGS